MALSNTAVPKYYGMFRDAVIRGEIPVNKEISMEMNRIDDLIANPGVYYDDRAVEGFIDYCESELTLTDGADLNLLDTFKPNCRPWRSEIDVRFLPSKLFSQCGRNHNAPDYYGSDNETGRRGFVSDSYLNHSCKRPILQIFDRGIFAEYDWF